MLVRALALVALIAVSLGTTSAQTLSPSPAGSASPPPSFAALAQEFFDASVRRDPLFADSLGVHAYDDRLPDYSAAGTARREAWLRRERASLGALDPAALSLDDAADRRTLLDTIDLELYEDGALHPYATQPQLYAGAIGDAVYELTARSFAPAAQRYRSVAARLRLVPALVAAARANLTVPPREFTLYAIDQNGGNIAMYEGLTADVSRLDAATRMRIGVALPPALHALRAFDRFLRGPLLARSRGTARVGAAVYDRNLALNLGTDLTRAQLLAQARAAFAATRERMLVLARPLYARMFPGRAVPADRERAIDTVVGAVLDRLSDDHPSRDAVFTTARADLQSIEAFLRRTKIVALPQPDTLHVVPTPAYRAGFGGASMDWAGPFTPLAESYYDIDQIPASWNAARVRSYLREYNRYEMVMLSLHEAIPGHYVQGRATSALRSITRRAFQNGAFVEGWAVYGEGMMLDAGFGDGDPKLRLFQLKWRLREQANTIVDILYHTAGLTRAQFDTLLVGKAFQEAAETETKWHRLGLSHAQLAFYFTGLQAIEAAQAAERAALGPRYSLANFNTRLLAVGSVEPRAIAPLLAASRP